MLRSLIALLVASTLSGSVLGAVCDYRPSQMVGKTKTAIAGGVSSVVAAAGVGLKAAGFYTLSHAITGATMLGSTATGSSAAGTVGIMAGTGEGLGAAAAVVMSPFVLIPAAVVATGIGAYEGTCYLTKPAEKPKTISGTVPIKR